MGAFLLVVALFMVPSSFSQSIGISDFGATAPVPGGNDQSQLLTAGMVTGGNAQDGLNYYADSTAPGQTFTTGPNTGGYIINSIYIQTARLDANSTATAQTYTLRLYSVTGSTATLLSTYETTNTLGFTDCHWLQYSGFFTNALQPNTIYAYTHHRNTSGWDLLGYNTGNPYSGGEMCVIPAAGGSIAFTTDHLGDAAFEVNLALPPAIPVIYQQPASQTVVVGQPVSFTVGIFGRNVAYLSVVYFQ